MFATILIPVMLLAPGGVEGRDEHVLRQFAQSVHSYAPLHQRALESVPRGLCGGAEDIELTRSLLDGEVRRLRPKAREGEIFTREVGALIRRRLEVAAVTSDPGGGSIRAVTVNAAYPPYFGDQPWAAFHALPPLPGELEYRLIGRDLVLVDVMANLVVDVLRDAIGAEE